MGGEGQQGGRQRLANACHLEVMEECTSLLRPNFKLILGEHKLVLCGYTMRSIIQSSHFPYYKLGAHGLKFKIPSGGLLPWH